MENPRLLLIIGIAVVGLFLFQSYNSEVTKRQQAAANKHKKPKVVSPDAMPGSGEDKKTSTTSKSDAKADDKKVADNKGDTSKSDKPADTAKSDKPADSKKLDIDDGSVEVRSSKGKGGVVKGSGKLKSGQRVVVTTDVLRVELDTVGGDVRKVELIEPKPGAKDGRLLYPVSLDKPKTPLVLLRDDGANPYVAETAFEMSGANKDRGPDYMATWSVASTSYELAKGQNELKVDFTWQKNGVTITKTYIFRRNKYAIDVNLQVDNKTGTDWVGRIKRRMRRAEPLHLQQSAFLPIFTGAAFYTSVDGYNKINFSDISEAEREYAKTGKSETVKLSKSGNKGGWVAMMQHYFVGAWIPPGNESYSYFQRYDEITKMFAVVAFSRKVKVPKNDAGGFKGILYVGPKVEKRLLVVGESIDGKKPVAGEKTGDKFERTIDFGWLTIISEPLFWILEMIYGVVKNWGWAIIFLTILIKLVFYKLSETSYRSMARMKKVSPRLQALKDRYGDDKQGLHQAMMDLYKKEKINPFGGCFPILIQIPVFIALYYVLLESVELRHAPFMLWIQDLASPDPYYILPVLMGATMIAQHKLNPSPLDPIQQKVMMALPIVFTVFFMFFPAGLVLYWFVNNLLSIAQQYVITQRVEGKPIFPSKGSKATG